MNKEIEKWERQEGVKFLRRIGLCANQTVLDFGCRVGHYTIPAARIVANDGAIYAVDKEQEALSELQQKVKAHNLKNVKIMKTSGQINLDFECESIGVVLFYDVLHYLEKNDRKKLYEEAFRVLKQDGLLSVYPKHTLEDNPIRQFKELNLNDVKREIEDSDFHFEEKYCGIISHDDGLNHGCVLNFRKGQK
jgi:ubiquinone/menaquinone biosynthesis C-methylase UbiE